MNSSEFLLEEENSFNQSLNINPHIISADHIYDFNIDIPVKEKDSKYRNLIKLNNNNNDYDYNNENYNFNVCPYCGHLLLNPPNNILSSTDETYLIDLNKKLSYLENKNTKKKISKNTLTLGRKRKYDKAKSFHTKFNDDNMIRKIKSYFMNYLTDLINSKLVHNNKKFLKLDKEINENICIDYNLRLMQTDISQIFKKYKINRRYKKIENKMINIHLLNEIYETNGNKEVKKILNSKYIDMIKYMRENDLDQFKEYLLKRALIEGDNKEDAEKYIDKVVELLFSFEQWFKDKNGRIKSQDQKKNN